MKTKTPDHCLYLDISSMKGKSFGKKKLLFEAKIADSKDEHGVYEELEE